MIDQIADWRKPFAEFRRDNGRKPSADELREYYLHTYARRYNLPVDSDVVARTPWDDIVANLSGEGEK